MAGYSQSKEVDEETVWKTAGYKAQGMKETIHLKYKNIARCKKTSATPFLSAFCGLFLGTPLWTPPFACGKTLLSLQHKLRGAEIWVYAVHHCRPGTKTVSGTP